MLPGSPERDSSQSFFVIAISISIDSHGRECSSGDFYSLTDHGNRKMLLMFKLHTPLFSFGCLFLVLQLQAVC